MKTLQSKPAVTARVILNTSNSQRHQRAEIREYDRKGRKIRTAHQGQVPYIVRLARNKYNLDLMF
jgi:hypothetical protein